MDATRAGAMLATLRLAPTTRVASWFARRTLATQRFPVPAMGDSITEGTLLELHKRVGDYVGMEELLAMVETDKVTVEVRSPAAGTITALFADIDDNLVVGADLLEIDVGVGQPGVSTAVSAPASSSSLETAPSPTATQAHSTASKSESAVAVKHIRIHPSGKPSLMSFPARGATVSKAMPSQAHDAATPRYDDSKPSPLGTIPYMELPLRFRRSLITEEEIEAIELGGAGVTF